MIPKGYQNNNQGLSPWWLLQSNDRGFGFLMDPSHSSHGGSIESHELPANCPVEPSRRRRGRFVDGIRVGGFSGVSFGSSIGLGQVVVFLVGWWFQLSTHPKNMSLKMGIIFPQVSGWKIKKNEKPRSFGTLRITWIIYPAKKIEGCYQDSCCFFLQGVFLGRDLQC